MSLPTNPALSSGGTGGTCRRSGGRSKVAENSPPRVGVSTPPTPTRGARPEQPGSVLTDGSTPMVITQGQQAGTTELEAPAVEVVGVSKRFGAVQALKDVSVAFFPGEVHALVG